jgi:hypothetical protein
LNQPLAADRSLEPAVRGWITALTLGAPHRLGQLDVFPVIHRDSAGEPALLGHEAVATGVLEVVEKDGGVVQQLLARNKGKQPVVIIEGETLIGARQNRIVAHTVVIAPGGEVVVPVGCMEQGRWHFTSAQFQSGASPSEWKLRREIKSSVISSRSMGRPPALDQGALWARVEEELDAAKVRSSTRDYSALIEERRRKADALLADVRPVDGQVGLLALSNGELIGLEVVGSHEMWSRLADRALRSLLPAATDPESLPHRQGSHPRTPEGWLQTLAAGRIARRPALGLGADFELSAEGAIGSGVWLGDRPAHFSVFAQPMADGSDAA